MGDTTLSLGEREKDRRNRSGSSQRPSEPERVAQIAFTSDSQFVISGSSLGTIQVWDLSTAKRLARWRAHAGPVRGLAVSPSAPLVATASDSTIHLWELATGREVAYWDSLEPMVTALAFSADGATLASGNSQGILRLWNLGYIRQELAAIGLDWEAGR